MLWVETARCAPGPSASCGRQMAYAQAVLWLEWDMEELIESFPPRTP